MSSWTSDARHGATLLPPCQAVVRTSAAPGPQRSSAARPSHNFTGRRSRGLAEKGATQPQDTGLFRGPQHNPGTIENPLARGFTITATWDCRSVNVRQTRVQTHTNLECNPLFFVEYFWLQRMTHLKFDIRPSWEDQSGSHAPTQHKRVPMIFTSP